MCVNDTFPPRVRRKWLLMTIRLSIRSFAGIARTLVAVGTVSDASMFDASALAMPLSGATTASSVASDGVAIPGASAGMGALLGPADVVRGAGGMTSMGAEGESLRATTGTVVSVTAGVGLFAFSAYASSVGIHAASTEEGSLSHCSYFSSTSQSLAPKSCDAGESGEPSFDTASCHLVEWTHGQLRNRQHIAYPSRRCVV